MLAIPNYNYTKYESHAVVIIKNTNLLFTIHSNIINSVNNSLIYPNTFKAVL